MSIFGQAQESADGVDDNADATAVQPEDETTTAAVTDTEAEGQAVAQESADLDQLEDEQDEVEEAGEIIEQESEGLTPSAARLLHITMKNIVGKSHANKVIATENYQSGRSAQREAKNIALEGIKETLKAFWDAIKKQLKKFYGKVKGFFVKAFSAARKLSDRAKKLQDKANGTTGTIEEKSFSFGQTKAISVDGKYNDPATVTGGLKEVRSIIEKILKVAKSDEYERIVDEAAGLIEATIKDGKAGNSVIPSGVNVLSKLAEAGGKGFTTKKVTETKLEEMYVPKDDKVSSVEMSNSLPGGKAVFVVLGGVASGSKAEVEEFTKAIRGTRTVLGNDKFNPRDVSEGDVKTLTTSQIDKVCDDVIEIAETSYTYEKAWEKRDKFQEKLEREVDTIIKDVNSDKDENGTVQRRARQYASSITGSVRRRTNFEAQFISYAVSTANAFLNYAERSLAQHKTK